MLKIPLCNLNMLILLYNELKKKKILKSTNGKVIQNFYLQYLQ